MTTPQGMLNTDREIYRSPVGSMHDDSIHVTEGGGIGINCGGTVVVKPLREWHRLARQVAAPQGREVTDEMVLTGAKAGNPIAFEKKDDGDYLLPDSARESTIEEVREVLTAALALAPAVAPDGAREREKMQKQIEQLQAKLYCMCGSSMDHSAWEGHSPVSMYDYALDQANERIKELEAALAQAQQPGEDKR